jgi:NAD(P)-dependent dehydrogenase (short-subunit alcohol dehydrogenase family)
LAQRARELEAELGSACHALIMDVCNPVSIQQARDVVSPIIGESLLRGVVNNAGIAVGGPWQYLDVSDFRHQLEVNLVGPLQVVQAFLPLLGARQNRPETERPGRIVNISSVSGLIAYPFLGPYAVSKHGLEAFGDSLRRELLLWGIDVVTIGPGNVATPIWDKAQKIPIEPFIQTAYGPAMQKTLQLAVNAGRKGMLPTQIAKRVRRVFCCRLPRARYSIVQSRLLSYTLPRLLPKRWFDRIIAAMLGLGRN